MSRYPIDGDHPLVPALRATFDAAREFGLSDDELWSTVQEALSESDGSSDLCECVDRLNGDLARAILSKPRSGAHGFAWDAGVESRLGG